MTARPLLGILFEGGVDDPVREVPRPRLNLGGVLDGQNCRCPPTLNCGRQGRPCAFGARECPKQRPPARVPEVVLEAVPSCRMRLRLRSDRPVAWGGSSQFLPGTGTPTRHPSPESDPQDRHEPRAMLSGSGAMWAHVSGALEPPRAPYLGMRVSPVHPLQKSWRIRYPSPSCLSVVRAVQRGWRRRGRGEAGGGRTPT